MTIKRIKSGGIFEDKVGYCRAVVAGDTIYVSGTVYPSATPPAEVAAQCAGALEVIGAALSEAGASFADVVRVHYILPDPAEFADCWPILTKTFGQNPPAATMFSADLIDPKYRIEIEVTAYKP